MTKPIVPKKLMSKRIPVGLFVTFVSGEKTLSDKKCRSDLLDSLP